MTRDRRKRALLLMPFDEGASRVQDTVTRVLEDTGYVVSRLDRLDPGFPWARTILDAIEASSLIIADISRNNPNVWYEVGFAHALRKRTLLILDRTAPVELPSDVVGHVYVTYDQANLTSFRDRMRAIVRQLLEHEA